MCAGGSGMAYGLVEVSGEKGQQRGSGASPLCQVPEPGLLQTFGEGREQGGWGRAGLSSRAHGSLRGQTRPGHGPAAPFAQTPKPRSVPRPATSTNAQQQSCSLSAHQKNKSSVCQQHVTRTLRNTEFLNGFST